MPSHLKPCGLAFLLDDLPTHRDAGAVVEVARPLVHDSLHKGTPQPTTRCVTSAEPCHDLASPPTNTTGPTPIRCTRSSTSAHASSHLQLGLQLREPPLCRT